MDFCSLGTKTRKKKEKMSLSKIWFFKLLSLTKLGLVGVTALSVLLLCCTIWYCCSVKVNKNLSRRPLAGQQQIFKLTAALEWLSRSVKKRSRRHLFYDYSVAILYYSITEFTVYENYSKRNVLLIRNNI